jgi:oxygen-dependent protoporphyrinogen oxidase
MTHGGIIKGAIALRSEPDVREAGRTASRGFLSFDGGMSVLVDRAVETARCNGARFGFGVTCTSIERSAVGIGYRLTLVNDGQDSTEHVEGVVVATPAWVAAPLLASLAPAASEELARIEHVSNAVIAMAFPQSQLPRALDGYGYVVPRIENRDVMAMTWMSSKWPNRAPDGQVVVRVFVGRAGQTSALKGSDDFLVQVTLKEVRDVFGLDVTPTLTRVHRWDRGMPQYNMGHLERVERIESSLARIPGIEIAGNMLHGVGIPDCIVSGELAATNLLADL